MDEEPGPSNAKRWKSTRLLERQQWLEQFINAHVIEKDYDGVLQFMYVIVHLHFLLLEFISYSCFTFIL
jgi:hypothetical protein